MEYINFKKKTLLAANKNTNKKNQKTNVLNKVKTPTESRYNETFHLSVRIAPVCGNDFWPSANCAWNHSGAKRYGNIYNIRYSSSRSNSIYSTLHRNVATIQPHQPFRFRYITLHYKVSCIMLLPRSHKNCILISAHTKLGYKYLIILTFCSYTVKLTNYRVHIIRSLYY